MVNHVNENEYGHVLTIEDPIEFLHESKKCLINQREVGPHTLSFSNALRSALREDPDSSSSAKCATWRRSGWRSPPRKPATSCSARCTRAPPPKTIDRIIDVFPAAEKEMVRAMLSESLVSVISQTLLKTQGRPGPPRRARDPDRQPRRSAT